MMSSSQSQQYEAERAKVSVLFAAAASGDAQPFTDLIGSTEGSNERANVLGGYLDANKRHVLHFAASQGQLAVCRVVLEECLSTKEQRQKLLAAADINGDTALRLAVRTGHVDTAALLYSVGAQEEDVRESATLLHEAASSGDADMVRLALEELGQGEKINTSSSIGTPLFWAAFNDDADVAGILIEKGADVDAKDGDGLSPLAVAATGNAAAVAKVLLEAGASLDFATNQSGATTVLHAAAASGAKDAVEAVLAGADEAALQKALSCASQGMTPMEAAAYAGHADVAALLGARMGSDAAAVEATCQEWTAKRARDEAAAGEAVEEAAATCEAAKTRGNEHFASGDTVAALAAYSEGVATAEAMLPDVTKALEAHERLLGRKNQVLAVLLANRCACLTKKGAAQDLEDARADAERATALRPKWPKAFYRLGTVLTALELHADAAQAYWTGYELDPKDTGAATLQAKFREAVRLGKLQHQAANPGLAVDAAPPVPPVPQQQFQHNLPVEIPTDVSPDAPLRHLMLPFNDGEDPMTVAARFIGSNGLDPSLINRIAKYVHDFFGNSLSSSSS